MRGRIVRDRYYCGGKVLCTGGEVSTYTDGGGCITEFIRYSSVTVGLWDAMWSGRFGFVGGAVSDIDGGVVLWIIMLVTL